MKTKIKIRSNNSTKKSLGAYIYISFYHVKLKIITFVGLKLYKPKSWWTTIVHWSQHGYVAYLSVWEY